MAVSLSPNSVRSTAAVGPLAHRVRYIRDLLLVLVSRDMKLRYKRSVLGSLWTLLNPLGQLLILSFLFRSVLQLAVPRYTSFLFCGLLVWTWFQAALSQATGSMIESSELLRRPGFPVSMLPIVTVTSHLIHFLLALPVLWLFLVLDGSHITSAVLALPLVIALQFMWTLSLAYLTAACHVCANPWKLAAPATRITRAGAGRSCLYRIGAGGAINRLAGVYVTALRA